MGPFTMFNVRLFLVRILAKVIYALGKKCSKSFYDQNLHGAMFFVSTNCFCRFLLGSQK